MINLREALLSHLKATTPRPIDTEYGSLYEPPWKDTFKKVYPNLRSTSEGEVDESIAGLVLSMFPPQRRALHPLDLRLNEVFQIFGISDFDHHRFDLEHKFAGKKELLLNGQDIKGVISFYNTPESWNDKAPNGRGYSTYFHSIRASLIMLEATDVLGFNNEWQVHNFIAALGHDSGSICFQNARNRDKSFPQYKEMMKQHPTLSAHQVSSFDPISAAIIERHHRWQPDPYPPESDFLYKQPTPEIEVSSKILTIVDCYEAATTREHREGVFISDLILRGGLPSKKKVREELSKNHAELIIKYDGNSLPKMDFSGKEFIDVMYDRGVFGRPSLNPYPYPYSFMSKKTIAHTSPHFARLLREQGRI